MNALAAWLQAQLQFQGVQVLSKTEPARNVIWADREVMQPALEAVIVNHLLSFTPVVLDGDYILPSLAAKTHFGDIPNAGLNRVRVSGETVEVLDWADVRHLADLPEQPVYDQTKLVVR